MTRCEFVEACREQGFSPTDHQITKAVGMGALTCKRNGSGYIDYGRRNIREMKRWIATRKTGRPKGSGTASS